MMGVDLLQKKKKKKQFLVYATPQEVNVYQTLYCISWQSHAHRMLKQTYEYCNSRQKLGNQAVKLLQIKLSSDLPSV